MANEKLIQLCAFLRQSKSHYFKYQDASIRRRIKSKACKSITKMLNEYFQKLPSMSALHPLKNLQPEFVRNISFTLNHKYFEDKVYQIYCHDFESHISGGKSSITISSSRLMWNVKIISLINDIYPQDQILNMKFKDLLQMYFDSHYFQNDVKFLEKQEHKFYLTRFNELSREFIGFYSKPIE